ncbi:MAG: AbrB/MazE/SpoVT family DNA-binding domain-containing protein, partial [bacterium]
MRTHTWGASDGRHPPRALANDASCRRPQVRIGFGGASVMAWNRLRPLRQPLVVWSVHSRSTRWMSVAGADLTAGSAVTGRTGKTIQGASMFDAATTTLSSKRQVVSPEAIRERLGLKTGAPFVVVADRDVVIRRVLEPPALSE